jgi:hypothetical protein
LFVDRFKRWVCGICRNADLSSRETAAGAKHHADQHKHTDQNKKLAFHFFLFSLFSIGLKSNFFSELCEKISLDYTTFQDDSELIHLFVCEFMAFLKSARQPNSTCPNTIG